MPNKLGDCFLFKSKTTSSPTLHLYIIVAQHANGNWIAVNVSSEGAETCCLLDGSDHPS